MMKPQCQKAPASGSLGYKTEQEGQASNTIDDKTNFRPGELSAHDKHAQEHGAGIFHESEW